MDKSKWTYKKLGEICEIVTGSTPKTEIPSYWGGNHYWVTPAELDDRVYIDSTERTITDEALSHSKLTLMPVGTVLLSSRAPIGKVAITRAPMYCNQGFKNLVCSDVIYNKFLYWFLKINTDYLNSLGRGATFKEISKAIVSDIKILLPPVDVQHDIADELDQLSELISLKQQQLKEYDALAQSLFYEIFVKITAYPSYRLSDLFEIGTGSTPSRKKEGEYYNGTFNWVKSTEVHGDDINNTEEKITKKALDDTNCKLYPSNTILIAMYGQGRTRGQVAKLLIPAATNQACAAILPNSEVCETDFLLEYLKLSYEKIRNMARGGTQSNLNLNLVKSIEMPLPPLPLQHSFAKKVRAIESQKSLVKQSIAETQTLLDSRMQEYFG